MGVSPHTNLSTTSDFRDHNEFREGPSIFLYFFAVILIYLYFASIFVCFLCSSLIRLFKFYSSKRDGKIIT